jgi:hypothetical protein
MWILRQNKLQQSAIGPVTVTRFLDVETKRTAVLHPPNQPDGMVVHVDRLIKAQERPAHLIAFLLVTLVFISARCYGSWPRPRRVRGAHGRLSAEKCHLIARLANNCRRVEIRGQDWLRRAKRSCERDGWHVAKGA